MPLLRDVLARFAVLVDDTPLTKLDKRIERVKDNLAKFAKITAGGLALGAAGAYKLIDSASRAAEIMNVLQRTFEGNSDSIVAWSKTMSKELGRSEYSLQDYASKFGAFLEPQFRGTKQDISEMSKRLSELAVDLASFYNTSDEEASMRLFSGLSGETEAVRRLGIDISDTSLSDFNHKRGDNRNMAQLNLQETLLRYEKILSDTVKKQGDAKLTASGWANSLRRLTDQFKTLSTRVGQLLIGPATKLLWWGERMTQSFETLTLKTSAWQAAFATATSVGLVYGARWLLLHKDLVKWADLLNKEFWTMNLRVLGIVGAFLLLEDLFTLMRGGKSVWGDFITQMSGVQRPVDVLEASFEKLAQYANNFYIALTKISTWTPPALLYRLAKGITGNGFGMDADKLEFQQETYSEGRARNRPRALDDAVIAGDKTAYIKAQEGSGLSDTEIDSAWARDRKTALRSKRVQANEQDLGSGFIEVPKFATMSGADRNKYYSGPVGGSSTRTNNTTININGGDTAAVKRAVREALDEDLRGAAVETGEGFIDDGSSFLLRR